MITYPYWDQNVIPAELKLFTEIKSLCQFLTIFQDIDGACSVTSLSREEDTILYCKYHYCW